MDLFSRSHFGTKAPRDNKSTEKKKPFCPFHFQKIDRLFITPDLLRKLHGTFDPNIFTRWQREGRVEKIRNGLYIDKEYTFRGALDRYKVSNQLYAPSYISLFSALRFYNFIPEIVYETTAVSTRKTQTFRSDRARYTYRQIKKELFFGFVRHEWRGGYYAMHSQRKRYWI